MIQVRTTDGELFVGISANDIVEQMRMTVWEPRPATVLDYVVVVADRVEQMTGKRPRLDPEEFLSDLAAFGLIEMDGASSELGDPGSN